MFIIFLLHLFIFLLSLQIRSLLILIFGKETWNVTYSDERQ